MNFVELFAAKTNVNDELNNAENLKGITQIIVHCVIPCPCPS